ncbi:hypothetical protein FRC08_014239 [Ceratobasidium sp. 394]|nr:hypothetical protein FRC08_014239 [Ceratobasidium sp. 394]
MTQHLKQSACTPLHELWKKQMAVACRKRERACLSAAKWVEPVGQGSEHAGDGSEHAGEGGGPIYADEPEGRDDHRNYDDAGVHAQEGGEAEEEWEDEEQEDEELEDKSASDFDRSESHDSDIETLADDDQDDKDEDAMDWDCNPPKNPTQSQSPTDPRIEEVEDEEPELVILERVVDQHGNKYYIEPYPSPTAGEPTHLATPDDVNWGDYPDIGELGNPNVFEVVQSLIDSGMSGKFWNKFL